MKYSSLENQKLKQAIRSATAAGLKNSHRVNAARLTTVMAGLSAALFSGTSIYAQENTVALSNLTAQTPFQVEEILVTSRLRRESVQDVPIPLTVIGGDRLSAESVYTIDDLTRLAPGLTATTPNGRRTGISIRGIGKASGNDSMEAAVGVIVDDVFLSHVGMSYQDFTDLERVELLRGPQGTLLGKNTTMGAINYVSRQPVFDREVSYTAEVGANNTNNSGPGALRGNGSISDALIDDVLAFRASFFVDTQQGDIKNINPQGAQDRYHEKNRYGGRIQFLYTPSDDVRIRLNFDAAESDENSNTKPIIFEPETFADGSPRTTTYSTRLSRDYFGGYEPIIGSWDTTDIAQARPLKTKNRGASVRADWDLASVTLSSITAYREFFFDAVNDSEETRFDINTSGTLVEHDQISQEFRFSYDQGGSINYQAGLYYLSNQTESTGRTRHGKDAGAFFASNAQYSTLNNTSSGRLLLSQSLDELYVGNTTTPETESAAIFGQLNWNITDQASLTLGVRNTYEEKNAGVSKAATFNDGTALTPLVAPGASAQELAAANAIREGRVGSVYGLRQGDQITNNAISWLVSPQYQLSDDILLYSSVAYGEKSGSVQFNSSNGDSITVEPEEVTNFELGIKSTWFDRLLTLNVNLYHTAVDGYQSVTSLVDPTTTTGFRSQLGNIPEITARGLEFEGNFYASENLWLNFGGAFNDAKYDDWRTATCPAEVVVNAANPVCDFTGRQVVGAPRLSANLGLRYQHTLSDRLKIKAFTNTVFRSSHNLEANLSVWGEVGSYALHDGGIGLVFGQNEDYELNLVAKNIGDKKYTTSVNNFSSSYGVGYDGIGARRYVGIVLNGKF